MNHKEVQQYSAGVGIEWAFNIERAPWWALVGWDLQTGQLNDAWKKMIGRAKLSYDDGGR